MRLDARLEYAAAILGVVAMGNVIMLVVSDGFGRMTIHGLT